jgi:hypothetical protein
MDSTEFTEQLVALVEMARVKVGDNGRKYVEINNAHFVTDGINTPAVVTIDSSGASGWQWPIQIARPDGYSDTVKCLGCDELSEDGHVMCARCKKALITIRGLGDERAVAALQILADPAMEAFFKLLTVDGFKAYMEEQIGAIAGDA